MSLLDFGEFLIMGNAAAFANFAHQVVEVKPGSPAAKSGLCGGEDYVIVFDGFLLTQLSPQEILCVVTVCSE